MLALPWEHLAMDGMVWTELACFQAKDLLLSLDFPRQQQKHGPRPWMNWTTRLSLVQKVMRTRINTCSSFKSSLSPDK